ncbi:exonuclease sbcCD subunit D [Cellulomonas sp. WB94]|uniref:exonuclease SbcCD subunit D n=1 Tax=Cellulomonas sp. WB94 TaxID=2173174 RepID=UPI000D56E94F|nr:exonuclease SbcCD subunit D [Cellulomonas sp. WB94]PVU82895.1 exonuclease sbcCD subunit D [Cellulomonas sp. WB94]
MRVLHTSDWHLGRTLHGVDLLDHQAAYLDHLVDLTRSEGVGAVLVAGDVYDRAVPPVEAVVLLSETLARLAEHATVVVTPGNHDSAARLGFGAAIMRDRIQVRTRVAGLAEPVVLPDDAGDLLVYALPYLDPDVVRRELSGDDVNDPASAPLPRSHEAVVSAAMTRVRRDLATRVDAAARSGRPRPRAVVMAHAFVVGGEPSESERDIRVGGVDHVPAGVFAGMDYVALGHLHGPQRVGAPEGSVLRYSGSPLAYSFSEQHHHKSTVLLDLGSGTVEPELVPAPVPRRLADVIGTLEDLLGAAGEPHLDDWLRVTVTDAHRPADLYRRVKERFAHALVIQHRPPERASDRAGATVVTSANDPLVVAAEFVVHVTGAEPTEAELAVLRRAYEQVTAGERSA